MTGMHQTDDKKTLDERIDDHNRSRTGTKAEQLPGRSSLTTEQRPSETHNTVSTPEGDSSGENKVWTSLDDE
jgi:hypothetical protein